MNSRKLWNMQRIGISPHLLLSTQIEGSLMLYLSWGCLMAYCTFQTIQTCSSEGHKGTISVVYNSRSFLMVNNPDLWEMRSDQFGHEPLVSYRIVEVGIEIFCAYHKYGKLMNHGNPTSHKPELVLNNFTTRLGHRVGRMIQSLFPQDPNFHGRRVVTFHNQRDYILFRHHRAW
ncbi:Ribosomal RNA processing Brix domain protein [Zea mays]|uniref:Ribosomal RNA processing Brix domain protein n=1 Tax=Zea mays TaxID=4577 RepID=A0A1D6Q9V6_MAIZE|nr:Ribosomal RNA processing Brix domain protein [Zea mays]